MSNSHLFHEKNEISLRLKFDDNADIYLSDFYFKLSQLLMTYHVNLEITQDIVLIPNIDSLGLSFDSLFDKLNQVISKFDIFKGRIVNRCEIMMNSNHVLVIHVPVYVRYISSLNEFLTELLGLQANSATTNSEVVFLQIGTCMNGYEFEAESIKRSVDDFLKESSAFVTLYWDAIDLIDSRGAKPSLFPFSAQSEFKFEGGMAKNRISSFVKLEEDSSSSLDDIAALGIINRSREESLLEDFNQYFSGLSNISPFSNSAASTSDNNENNPASSQLSLDAIGSNDGSSSSIFSFNDGSLHLYPETPSSASLPLEHFANAPAFVPVSKASPGNNPLAGSFSPARDMASASPPYIANGFPPHGPSAGYAPYNQYTTMMNRSPGKPGISAPISASDQSTDRDYCTNSNSRPSSQINNPWSDTASDIIDASYDIYRVGYLSSNTRQRQHSDPIVPLSRGRQHSDPIAPSAYQGYHTALGSYPPGRPKVPPNSMSTTPERKPSIDGNRQPNGMPMNYFPRPPPKSFSMDFDGRGRSVSESGTLNEGQTIQQYYRSIAVSQGISTGFNSNRGLLTCPSCHTNVKRNQSVCPRCMSALPVAHAASHNDIRTLQSYSSYPSESSLNSDSLSHHSGMHEPSHRESSVRQGDWICGYCHGHNFATKIACFTCHAARPGFERGIPVNQMEALGIGRLGGASAEAKPGDWTCPKCHENVFAKRNRCYRCTTSRPRKLSH
jgi:hypothetical protein